MKRRILSNPYFSLFVGFVVLSMFALPNAPTMDDWFYLTSPKTECDGLSSLLVPIGTYWRPFDGFIGYINGQNVMLFPLLNHVLVVIGHIINSLLVYKIATTINIDNRGALGAMLFFMYSPGMLGTVLDIDSINQVYSLLWGLAATLVYLRGVKQKPVDSMLPKRTYLKVALLIFVATLCKENGIVFIVAAPVLAYGLGFQSFKCAARNIVAFMLIPLVYCIIRFSLPVESVELNVEYIEGGVYKIARNVAMFFVFSWLPWDFVSILHEPSRNIPLAIASIMLSIPYLIALFSFVLSTVKYRRTHCLLACMVMLACIHLATIFTVMHTYSSLCMVALIVGLMFENIKDSRRVLIVLVSFLLSSAVSDTHHALKAYESGEIGHEMALSAIGQCNEIQDKVLVIRVNDDYPKYSMFCTIPADAFGDGMAALYENKYEWPKELATKEISEDEKHLIDNIVHEAFASHYDGVWIVEGREVKVINKS